MLKPHVLEHGILLRQQRRERRSGIPGEMHIGRINEVEIVAGRLHTGVACAQCPVPRRCAPPCLDDHVRRRAAVQHLVPADQALAVAGGQGGHPSVEVCLQGVGVIEFVLRHVGADLRTLRPPCGIHLVAAHVHMAVGKQLGKLPEQCVDGRIHRLVGDVEHRLVRAEPPARANPARHLGGTRLRTRVCRPLPVVPGTRAGWGPLRVRRQPTGHVPGHVQLRHDPDSPVGGPLHQFAKLSPGVVLPAGEFWPGFARQAEALVVAQVQVQDVQPVERHDIEDVIQDGRGDEMADHVQHEPAPREPGFVLDAPDGQPPGGVGELRQGGQRVQRSPGAVGGNRDAIGCDVEPECLIIAWRGHPGVRANKLKPDAKGVPARGIKHDVQALYSFQEAPVRTGVSPPAGPGPAFLRKA